jgi:probable F420-dependent oxidoreductase
MRVGVSPHPLWPRQRQDFDQVLSMARMADELGFDHVFAAGHVVAGAGGLTLDPLVLLSAVAGATSRTKLLTSVLVLPLYHPVVLANQASTLDLVSGGRLVLCVGTGWDVDEFAAVGVPFGERGARADESLEVMRSLWSDGPSDYRGRFTSLRGTSLGTPPLTPGGPPVWVGGNSDAALRRALRFGTAWHGTGADAATVRKVRARLSDLAGAADPLELTSGQFLVPPGILPVRDVPFPLLGGRHPTADSVLADLAALEEAGLSTCSLWMPIAQHHYEDALGWLAAEVLTA